MAPFMIHRLNGVVMPTYTRIRPMWVSSRPSASIIPNTGTMISVEGMIRVRMIPYISVALPRKVPRERA